MHGLFWTLTPFFGWSRYLILTLNEKNYNHFKGCFICRYVPEANMTACGTDYLTMTWHSRSYVFIYACFAYFLPLLVIIYAYYFIVKASLIKSISENISFKLHFEIGSSNS